jgi:hypothetical protein
MPRLSAVESQSILSRQPGHCLAARSGRSAGVWGEDTQAPSSGDFKLRVDADYWVQVKPFSSRASKILNSPVIHSQNTVIPSLPAVRSENDF